MSNFDLNFDKAEVFCAWCRRLKDKEGQPCGDVFPDPDSRYNAGTHGICRPCVRKHLPDVAARLGY